MTLVLLSLRMQYFTIESICRTARDPCPPLSCMHGGRLTHQQRKVASSRHARLTASSWCRRGTFQKLTAWKAGQNTSSAAYALQKSFLHFRFTSCITARNGSHQEKLVILCHFSLMTESELAHAVKICKVFVHANDGSLSLLPLQRQAVASAGTRVRKKEAAFALCCDDKSHQSRIVGWKGQTACCCQIHVMSCSSNKLHLLPKVAREAKVWRARLLTSQELPSARSICTAPFKKVNGE